MGLAPNLRFSYIGEKQLRRSLGTGSPFHLLGQ